MWTTRASAIALIVVSGKTHDAEAACSCHCVNGQVQALCTSPMDIQPICSPTICPIVPPSIRPIETPRLPPIGTTQCSNQQVYNPYTRQYEWKQLCR
jgi:hypothetical protein